MKKVPSEKEITNICRIYLRDYWNEDLVTHIKIDGRLKNSLGYFRHYGNNPGIITSIKCIKFSKDLFLYYPDEEIKKVILHELTHYVLYKRGIKEYHDGEKFFEREIKRVNSASTNCIPHHGKIYKIYCPSCKKIIGETIKKRKANNIVNNYLCSCRNTLEIEEYIR